MSTLPSRARVVIIGGGIVGASVAYHLTKLGWSDVVLLEQGQLSSGTTWHAAGLVGQLRATEGGTRLVQYSAKLYQELEAETGLGTGYKECGGVTVARTPDRMVQLLRTAAAAERLAVATLWSRVRGGAGIASDCQGVVDAARDFQAAAKALDLNAVGLEAILIEQAFIVRHERETVDLAREG
jgi:glycine/D-amino acid oxidase-like deaminating enzyme